MKLDQDPRTFESNTAGGRSAFTIAASSKAFQILSDQLYTDKPRAILRELSTNALDAHIAAGKPEMPFEVQLPTTWDSTLIVKDWGTGLSPEQIKSLYTTYFESDKTHTNDLVGGLGLGSKSPFAYTDQFTAISRWHGTRYTYAAFIGEGNVPEISLVGQEETDEGNGFEVHVPVKEGDIWTFEKTAKRVFEFFPVKPRLNQSIDFIQYAEPAMTIEHEDITCELYVDQEATLFMQGPIGYPVDRYAVMNDMAYNKRSKVEKFLEKGWRIKAPVGTFEITASREALSYNKQTIARLLELAHTVLRKVKEEAQEKLSSVANLKEASDLMVATGKYLPESASLTDTVWKGMRWNGRGFSVDLPPDTMVRELRRHKNGKYRSDPHETVFHDHSLLLGDYNYRVYWSQRDRPYKNFVAEHPVEEDKDRILYFTGPTGNLRSWLESVGLPVGREMPKPVKGVPGTRKVNYGATRYPGYCLTQDHQLDATANEIPDEANAYLLLASQSSIHSWRQRVNLLKRLELFEAPQEEIYAFYVPDSHTKVRKAIEGHAGFITPDLLLEFCKPEVDILRKTALIEAFARTRQYVDTHFNGLAKAIKAEDVMDEDFQALVAKVTAVTEVNQLKDDAGTIKNQLDVFDLPYDAQDYTRLVERFIKRQTQDLQTGYDKYRSIIDPLLKGYSESVHGWRHAASPLRTILTDWVNTQVELLSSTPTQEVA